MDPILQNKIKLVEQDVKKIQFMEQQLTSELQLSRVQLFIGALMTYCQEKNMKETDLVEILNHQSAIKSILNYNPDRIDYSINQKQKTEENIVKNKKDRKHLIFNNISTILGSYLGILIASLFLGELSIIAKVIVVLSVLVYRNIFTFHTIDLFIDKSILKCNLKYIEQEREKIKKAIHNKEYQPYQELVSHLLDYVVDPQHPERLENIDHILEYKREEEKMKNQNEDLAFEREEKMALLKMYKQTLSGSSFTQKIETPQMELPAVYQLKRPS